MMTEFYITCIMAVCASSCSSEHIDTASVEQPGVQLQGSSLQGLTLQGLTLQGFQFSGAALGGSPLSNLRVERGELVAAQDGVTLRGASLVGSHLYAQASSPDTSPPANTLVEYRITDIILEPSAYDPTQTGSTFLYTLEQNVDNSGSWQPACPMDSDGLRVAIPLAATWGEHGERIESSELFTFGCTTGVIAKCYRWGYRPWVTGYGDLAAMHWACTRLARADYCGDGTPHTQNGTWINIWDELPPPGPIQAHGAYTPPGMLFEAAWNTGGAVCLGRTRWSSDMAEIAATCPDRLMPPGQATMACDSEEAALGLGLPILLFNESYDNID